VAIPKSPVIQHQNTAPGPPMAIAVDTPMMFPVPIVAASAVASAENGETDSSSAAPAPFPPDDGRAAALRGKQKPRPTSFRPVSREDKPWRELSRPASCPDRLSRIACGR